MSGEGDALKGAESQYESEPEQWSEPVSSRRLTGVIVRAKNSESGRLWRVVAHSFGGRGVRLIPIRHADDAGGGVKPIWKSYAELDERFEVVELLPADIEREQRQRHLIYAFERFEERENGCWDWRLSLVKGYGVVNIDGKKVAAHRFVYELCEGPIPEGLTLDHLCRNRRCVNPAHLEPVTGRENTLRGEGLAARQARQTHCIHGHPFDEANTGYHKTGARYCRACDRERRRAALSEAEEPR